MAQISVTQASDGTERDGMLCFVVLSRGGGDDPMIRCKRIYNF
jgi:hypothetical protein